MGGKGSGDRLARGAKSAPFFTGGSKGDVQLKNVSSEPREDFTPVVIEQPVKVKRIVPLYDRVLIRRDEPSEITAGGIVLALDQKEKPMEGTIVAVGNGRLEGTQLVPLQVKAGSKVLFGKYAGVEVRVNGEDVLMMREEEILAILEE